MAAAYVQPGARVLDLGCGAMTLERYLPPACTYQPCDLIARDDRTLVCDFNAGEFPDGAECDIVFALGLLEHLADLPAFLSKLRTLGKPVIFSYSVAESGPQDRTALGWANHHRHDEILGLFDAAGLPVYLGTRLDHGQILGRAEPKPLSSADAGLDAAATALGRLAARMLPAHAEVLDIGHQAGLVGPFRPMGCSFLPAREIPDRTSADIVLMLEAHRGSVDDVAGAARRLGKPLICTWPAESPGVPNLTALQPAMKQAGFSLRCAEQATSSLSLLKWEPEDASARAFGPAPVKQVLVMSHFNSANFGDRLGYHIITSLLPANAQVTFGSFEPWRVPDREYDLLILGIGTSLLVKDARDPRFIELLDRTPKVVGIFGTQFRYQYRHPLGVEALDRILSKATTWWARYEEDVLAFGKGRTNVRHLGDWLISAFAMTTPSLDKSLTIPYEVPSELSLDRMIQKIQSYREVESGRLHPFLCALASAERATFREQTSAEESHQESGKFRSLLYDIFGQAFEAGQAFRVDHDAVRRYKDKVDANMQELRAELHRLLA